MQLDRYELSAGRNLATFEFVSEGRKGRILKVIQFEPMEAANVFNLAFGDVSATSNQLDDKTVIDNGDTEKVLATVVAAVYAFADRHPAAWIYATGSTAARTRLYRMGIISTWKLWQPTSISSVSTIANGSRMSLVRAIRRLPCAAKFRIFKL